MLSAAFASPELWEIIALSLRVSLSATAAAAMLGLPLGTLLAISRFPGRRAVIILVNALLGLPPAVVGLVLYLVLSRSGPLGFLGPAVHPGGDDPGADHAGAADRHRARPIAPPRGCGASSASR